MITYAVTHAATLIGVRAHLLRVEADAGCDSPGLRLVGLADSSIATTRDRVRAALINSGWAWPDDRVTISLSPVSLPKHGAIADLAIAVVLLAAAGKLPGDGLAQVLLLGELGLDGSVRPVRGVLPAVGAAAAEGITTVVVPSANAAEAAQVPGVVVVPATHVAELVGWLKDGDLGSHAYRSSAVVQDEPGPPVGDLADVPGNRAARHAVEVAAAGGHNLFLWGRPGSRATMLVHRMAGLLPALDPVAVREVAEIYSLAGEPAPAGPPLVAPHYTSTSAALFGGGAGVTRPGAVSLAHCGLLILEEAPEFTGRILDGLRHPLKTGEVLVSRWDRSVRLPARFMLALTSYDCPCPGSGPYAWSCGCTTAIKRRYLGRLARVLRQVEVRAQAEPADVATARDGADPESSTAVAGRVLAARERSAARLAKTPWRTNAQVPYTVLSTDFQAHPDALDVLQDPLNAGLLPTPRLPSVLRVAWTLADLRGADRPGRDDVMNALRLSTNEPR